MKMVDENELCEAEDKIIELQAELDAANKKIQAAIVAIKNGYGGDTYNSKTIEILKGE